MHVDARAFSTPNAGNPAAPLPLGFVLRCCLGASDSWGVFDRSFRFPSSLDWLNPPPLTGPPLPRFPRDASSLLPAESRSAQEEILRCPSDGCSRRVLCFSSARNLFPCFPFLASWAGSGFNPADFGRSSRPSVPPSQFPPSRKSSPHSKSPLLPQTSYAADTFQDLLFFRLRFIQPAPLPLPRHWTVAPFRAFPRLSCLALLPRSPPRSFGTFGDLPAAAFTFLLKGCLPERARRPGVVPFCSSMRFSNLPAFFFVWIK